MVIAASIHELHIREKNIFQQKILKGNRSQQLQHMSSSCKPTQVTALYQRKKKVAMKGKKNIPKKIIKRNW
jgi:hypothetical protein